MDSMVYEDLRRKIESDLGLNIQYVKGQNIPVRNCWHFSTDGNRVDFLFLDEEDFIAGTNRIFILVKKYGVVVLGYSLMDTHVHFVLWGELCDCQKFMHEYLKLTSMYLSKKYGDQHKLINLFPDYQEVADDRYLKTVICYVIKNAPVGGISYNALDYPWSSGPLYFRRPGYWSSPAWTLSASPSSCQPSSASISHSSSLGRTISSGASLLTDSSELCVKELRCILRTDVPPKESFKLIGSMVFPGEFVAVEIVEKIYRTHKSFNYFMCKSKESEVESVKGSISRLSVPNSELHQHKNELCREMFGVDTIRKLSTDQRLMLVRTLIAKYNCSPKQVAKCCGLIFSEVKSLL